MKKLTYNNFMKVIKFLEKEKHYSFEEAEALTRKVFENVEADKNRSNRPAEYFASLIVDKNEWVGMQ